MIKIALNGGWLRKEKPSIPTTVEEYKEELAWFRENGITHFHIHFRDQEGFDCLEMNDIRPQFEALKETFPDCMIGIGSPLGDGRTSELRFVQVSRWDNWKPDYISVNICEEGCNEFVKLLKKKQTPIEFGIFTMEDAKVFAAEGYNSIALRVLIEVPCDRTPEATVANAKRIYEYLSNLYPNTEYVMHGEESDTWAVIRYAQEKGLNWRIGLEDVDCDEHGNQISTNKELYLHALELGL